MKIKIASKIALLSAAALALASFGGTAHAAEPYGTWLRPSTGTQVNFYACGGKLCAKVAAVKDEARKKEVGTVIMKGAAKSGDNTWKGDLLDLESGKTYSGVVTLESASALNLKGCIAMVLCRGETWQKVK
jgi:uncharacterized protein (DUF2147 family)